MHWPTEAFKRPNNSYFMLSYNKLMAWDLMLMAVSVFAVYLFISVLSIYLRRWYGTVGSDGQEPSPTPNSNHWSEETHGRETGRASNSPAPDEVRCPACGATNDDSFSLCRNCVTDISSSSAGPVTHRAFDS